MTSSQSQEPYVFIKVDEGEGNGLTNNMTNFVAQTKEQGLAFVSRNVFAGKMSEPLQCPFAELVGYQVELYCSTSENRVTPHGMFQVSGVGGSLNGAGIYLGCSLDSGLSRFNNLAGPIVVVGRRVRDGKPLTSDALWGILNFIWDAMDLYGEDDDPAPTIMRWARRYREGRWQPMGGDGGVNVYCADVSQSKDPVETIDN